MRRPPIVFLGLLVAGIFLSLPVASPILDTEIPPEDPAIEVSLWAKQPMLKNPVAISHDPMGRIYATEANRRKSTDLDVRSMDGLEPLPWPALDYSIQSVEMRREVLREYLKTDGPYNNPWMKDYDGDGKKDWQDLTAKTERVNLLEDTDGDGLADKATVFAEGFNTEVTGTAGGVLWFDGKVYFTVIPDLWLLEDDDGDGVADQRHSLITGHGVHIGQGGHDLHGLTLGPDGRIYWSIGDKGINVTSKEGRRFLYPNQGLVMRSEPDGSNFEVFARGLRNCQELSFDDYGNLFCVDNDGDFRGERERLVYVTKDSDTGWRINWQYDHTNAWAASQRLPAYNPWMEEGLSVPHFEGQAAYITPALENYSDGPAGFIRNPGTALSEAYEDYYFLTQFPGQKITAFQLQPRGAAFEMVNEHTFQDGFMATGLSFGPDGALYVADWAGEWDPTEEGGIFKLDVKSGERHPLRAETERLIQSDVRFHSVDSLLHLLAYPDQRIRLTAQFELVRRHEDEMLLRAALDNSSDPMMRVHSLWGLGQLARNGELQIGIPVADLLEDADPQVQIQSCRLIEEAPDLFANYEAALVNLLKDPDLNVRFHAAQALGKIGTPASVAPLFGLLAGESGGDPFIRHGAVTGLAGIGDVDALVDAENHASTNVRIGALLALRRLASPRVAAFLDDPDLLVVLEAARAIHDDFGIPDAMPALAALLDTTPHTSNEALMRRVLNANLRLGGREQAEAALAFLQSGKGDAALQRETRDILITWSRPPVLDRVERRYRKLADRDPELVAGLLRERLPALLAAEGDAGEIAVQLLRHYDIQMDPAALSSRLADASRPARERIELFNLLVERPEQRKAAFDTAFESEDAALRMAALDALARLDEPAAVGRIDALLSAESDTAERQHALGLLGGLKGGAADRLLRTLVEKLAKDEIEPETRLDVYIAAEQLGGFEEDLADVRKQAGPGARAPYAFSLYGGDEARGAQIFMQHPVAQCIRCHAVDEDAGSAVGPNLRGAGSRFERDYLLESLVSPGKKLAAGFDNGTGVSVMPPMGELLSPVELRDVLAYLASLE